MLRMRRERRGALFTAAEMGSPIKKALSTKKHFSPSPLRKGKRWGQKDVTPFCMVLELILSSPTPDLDSNLTPLDKLLERV